MHGRGKLRVFVLIGVLRHRLLLEFATFKIGKEVQNLKLKLLLSEKVTARAMDASDFKKVDGHNTVDELQADVSGNVVLPQLDVGLLVLQEK